MSTDSQTVILERPYEVTIVSIKQELHETSGKLKKVSCKYLAHRKPVIAISPAAAESKVKRSLTSELEDEAADALIDTMKVSVTEVVNFQG